MIFRHATPTASPIPAPAPSPAPEGVPIRIRVSHYWPPLGGPNCAAWAGGRCRSRMASGEPWEAWVGRAIACPPEWPFGTRLMAFGREWICLDRGSRIRFEGGIPWVDFLTPEPPAPYGSVADAVLFLERRR